MLHMEQKARLADSLLLCFMLGEIFCMLGNNKRIKIVVGHYGSGKTEIALNMALKARTEGRHTTLIDLDIVNPFFRSAEQAEFLKENGIQLLAPNFANTAVDIPSLPAEITSVFEDQQICAIFDVGGDDAGAIALGQYRMQFEKCGYEMLYVVNPFRPRSSTVERILDMLGRIAGSSRLQPSVLMNNSNLGGHTSADILLEGQKILDEVSAQSGLPVRAICGEKFILDQLPDIGVDKFEIKRLLKPDWMEY